MARKLAPKLARVGVAWNPSEANSEACTKIARTVCRRAGDRAARGKRGQLGGRSRSGRLGYRPGGRGDLDRRRRHRARLDRLGDRPGPIRGHPRFLEHPRLQPARGPLRPRRRLSIRSAARSANWPVECLGESRPRSLPILYEVPRRAVDQPGRARARLRADGRSRRRSRPGPTWWSSRKGPSAARPRSEFAKAARKPVRAPRGCGRSDWSRSPMRRSWKRHTAVCAQGLKEAGLVEGRDFKINYRNAQGDIATLNSICDEMNGNDDDLVIAFTTTGAASRVAKDRPQTPCCSRSCSTRSPPGRASRTPTIAPM